MPGRISEGIAPGITGLHRLLSLDKFSEDITTQIDEARRLIGLENGYKDFTPPASGNLGRHDFVFRWVSGKLKDHASVRSCTEAWALLKDLLLSAPATSASVWLSAIDLTKLIIETLDEGLKEPHESRSQAHIGESNSKKRKRPQPADPAAKAPSVRPPLASLMVLDLLRDLHTYKDELSPSKILQEKFKTGLYSSAQELLKLINLVIKALVIIDRSEFANGSLESASSLTLLDHLNLIGALLKTYLRRFPSSPFASGRVNQLLWPHLAVLRGASTLGNHGADMSDQTTALRQIISEIMSRYVCRPLWTEFVDTVCSGNTNARTKAYANLEEHFRDWYFSVETMAPWASWDGASNDDKAISLLFSNCPHAISAETPSRRKASARFKEALYLAYANQVLLEQPDSAGVAPDSIMVMLDTVDPQYDLFQKHTLYKVITSHSWRSEAGDIIERDGLASRLFYRVLEMDGSFIVDTSIMGSTEFVTLLKALAWHAEDVTKLSEIVEGALLPIIRAHKTQQQVVRFFDIWQEILRDPNPRMHDDNARLCRGQKALWKSPSLVTCLSTVITASLDIGAVRRQLSSALSGLKSIAASMEISPRGRLGSKELLPLAMLVLAVLCDAIREDGMLDALQEDFKTILQDLISLTATDLADMDDETSAYLFSTLAAIHTKLAPSFGQIEVIDEFADSEGDLIVSAIRKAESTGRSTDPSKILLHQNSLAYVFQMCSFALSRPGGSDLVEMCLHALTTDDGSKFTAWALSSVLFEEFARHSDVWLSIPEALQKHALEYLASTGKSDDGSLAARLSAALSRSIKLPSAIVGLTHLESKDHQARATAGSLDGETMLVDISEKSLDSDRIIHTAKSLLGPQIRADERQGQERRLGGAWSSIAVAPRLEALNRLLSQDDISIAGARMVYIILESLQKGNLEPAESLSIRPILPQVARAAQRAKILPQLRSFLPSLKLLLGEKTSFVSQAGLEYVFALISHITSPAVRIQGPAASAGRLYEEVCALIRLILLNHRSSLGGRLHLLVPILTQLLSCLFTSRGRTSHNPKALRHPSWLHLPDAGQLTARHARLYARLVTLLCNPPPSTVPGHRHSSAEHPQLVDKVRETRLHVSEFVPAIVHAYCRFQLHGTMADGAQEELAPAVYAVFDVMDMGAPENGRVVALGASMDKAELALLRGEHGEWKRFGKWQGL